MARRISRLLRFLLNSSYYFCFFFFNVLYRLCELCDRTTFCQLLDEQIEIRPRRCKQNSVLILVVPLSAPLPRSPLTHLHQYMYMFYAH